VSEGGSTRICGIKEMREEILSCFEAIPRDILKSINAFFPLLYLYLLMEKLQFEEL
jgi:hypothetical protein